MRYYWCCRGLLCINPSCFLLQRCSNRYYFFFFSSRRRHTRCSRDWSSDVCSSDLETSFRDKRQPKRAIPPTPKQPSAPVLESLRPPAKTKIGESACTR